LPRGTLAVGKRVFLRRMRAGDEREFIALRRRNRTWLVKWEPRPPRGVDTFGSSGFRRLLQRRRSPQRCLMFVCLRDGGAILGNLNINDIVRGAFQSCTMGYWITRDHAGQGLMTEAVGLALQVAFERLDLHRVEANMMPRNTPSRNLARASGLRYEGRARRYLQIAGTWEDHERWAVTREEWHRRVIRPARSGREPTRARRARARQR
jgi:ribosomal-protein-alanine N-acetyltransferase